MEAKNCDNKNCEQINPQPLDNYYTQNKTRGNGERYVYYNNECKDCARKRANKSWSDNRDTNLLRAGKWRDNNREEFNRKYRDVYYPRTIEDRRKYTKDWRRENPDKVRKYAQYRYYNKSHNIPEKEWLRCKEYFNYTCAYCGLSEVEHKNLYKQQLHKEHVIHDGRNDIKNCVPSCKPCNGSKRTETLNKWYSELNPNYTQERYARIYQWIRHESKKTLQNNVK